MADFRINVIVDPQRARPGIDEIRDELDSLDTAGGRLNDNLSNLARDLDIPVDSVSGITTELTDGFDLATEATEALEAANDSVIGTVIETADAVAQVGDAATDLIEKGDGLDDLRARMAAISDSAEELSESLGVAGDSANDAVSGLGRSSGVIRGLAIGLGVVGAAIIAVGIGAVVTQDRVKDAFGELSIDVLDLGKTTLSAIRELLGPVTDFVEGAIDTVAGTVRNLSLAIAEFAGIDVANTRLERFNEGLEIGRQRGDEMAIALVDSQFDIEDALIRTQQALGLTNAELLVFNTRNRLADDIIDLQEEYSEAIREVEKAIEDKNGDENVNLGILAGLKAELADASAAYRGNAEAVLRQAEATATAIEQQERMTEAFATFNSLASEQSIFDRQIEDLLFLRDFGAITMDQFVESTLEALSRLGEEADRPFTELEQIAERGAATMKGVFADFLFEPFETGLDGLVVGFADAIRRMTSDALAAMLFESLFGGFEGIGGGPSGLGGIISGIFGGLSGFQNGGDFTVGGSGGPDSQIVAFKASPMENVSITTPGQQNTQQAQALPPEVTLTSVNLIDTGDIVAAMETPDGDRAFLNFISRKGKSINTLLGRS